MNVSMHLHDCKTNEKRCASASLIAEYERRNGQVTTIPPQRRDPDTRVDLVINARSFETGKKADGRHNERNAARLTIPVVKPDHDHPITNIMLNHAFRKLKVTKANVAKMMNRPQSYISNVCNGKAEASDETRRVMLACIWKLSEMKE